MRTILKTNILRALILPCLLTGTVYFHSVRSPSASATSDTFHARATLALCADYKFGGVTVELKYRVGAQSTYLPLSITSQSIDSVNNTGTFEFFLPSTMLSTPIAVAAFCRNSLGLGTASNEKIITNCDALAIRDTDFD